MPDRNIVTCFPLSDLLADQIRQSAGSDFNVILSSQDKIAEDILQADVFCGHAKVPLDWSRVVNQKRLKWIQSSAAGLDHCLLPEVIDSEIVVTGCSGLFANQVAEQTLALLLGLVRRLPVFFRAQQRKDFTRRPTDELFGKTIGIVGLGGNGQRIAKVLRSMVGRIVATDLFHVHCHPLIAQGVVDNVLPAAQLEHLLPQADILIVTLPLTQSNENRLSEDQFNLMRAGTYLINVGRGSVVNTECLVKNLQIGRLAGAGIDVVEPEPLPPESPLWEMDNVIITPHVGAQSAFRVPSTVDLFCKNLDRYRAGKSLLNLVDKNLGFPRPEHRISSA